MDVSKKVKKAAKLKSIKVFKVFVTVDLFSQTQVPTICIYSHWDSQWEQWECMQIVGTWVWQKRSTVTETLHKFSIHIKLEQKVSSVAALKQPLELKELFAPFWIPPTSLTWDNECQVLMQKIAFLASCKPSHSLLLYFKNQLMDHSFGTIKTVKIYKTILLISGFWV